MKLPEYRTKEPFVVHTGPMQNKELPTSSFVKLISDRWLPAHILNSAEFKYRKKGEVFVYCRWGLVLIPERIIYEVGR